MSEPVFYAVARAHTLLPGEMTYVEVGPSDEPVCLINMGGDFFALGDACTHEEASLSDGEISGDEIECPLHGGAFDIRTGAPTGFPVVVRANTYLTRVVNGTVEIALVNPLIIPG